MSDIPLWTLTRDDSYVGDEQIVRTGETDNGGHEPGRARAGVNRNTRRCCDSSIRRRLMTCSCVCVCVSVKHFSSREFLFFDMSTLRLQPQGTGHAFNLSLIHAGFIVSMAFPCLILSVMLLDAVNSTGDTSVSIYFSISLEGAFFCFTLFLFRNWNSAVSLALSGKLFVRKACVQSWKEHVIAKLCGQKGRVARGHREPKKEKTAIGLS